MIQLKPFIYDEFTCPECRQRTVRNNDVLIEGMHAVADNTCLSCGFEFYQLLPVGHTINYRIAYGKKNFKFYDDANAWVVKGLVKYFLPAGRETVGIRKIVFKECRNVMVLNALDFLYGHTLLKLFNCQHHLDDGSGLGLIVIIPANFEWLVPEGCAEIWVVDLALSRFHFRYHAIGSFVREELDRFDSVYLSIAYTHPDCSSLDISRFTGVAPFNLDMFTRKAVQITFVLREDRWWLADRVLYLTFQLLRLMGFREEGLKLLSFQQNLLVEQTVKIIKRKYPSSQFTVVGLGRTGRIKGAADRRAIHMTSDTERGWCNIYANSHLIIGVHGSNMILPTAHAAGCVEILPDDRLPNIVQDIAVRNTDRRQLFLYRFVDEFVKPATVAAHVVSILQGYDTFKRNMCDNQYRRTLVHDKDSLAT